MRIDNDIAIRGLPDDVWAILGDLAAVSRWVPGVTSARIEGSRRICTLEDGGEIHEEITEFSDERQRYAYEQVVHPLGFELSRGTLTVEGNGDGSTVAWRAQVELADPRQDEQVLPMLRRGYAAALSRLKEVVEQG
jgi:mxaD protein